VRIFAPVATNEAIASTTAARRFHGRGGGRARAIVAALLAAVGAAWSSAAPQTPPGADGLPTPIPFPELPGAASGPNMWFATPDPERERRSLVHHHATDRETPIVRVAAVLDGTVEAMAAFEDRAWIVLAPRAGEEPRREVVTLQTARNPVSELDYSWPREGPTLLPSLPGEGRLMGFAADATGPVALLWPESMRSERVRRGDDVEAAMPEVHRLDRRGRWIVEDPPHEPDASPWMRIVPRGGDRLGLLAAVEDGRACRVVPLGEATGDADVAGVAPDEAAHSSSELWPVSRESLVATTIAAGRPLMVLRTEFARIDLAYPRDGAILELAVLDSPRGPWRVDGTTDGIRRLEQTDEGFTIRSIDPIDGGVGPERILGPPSFGTGAWLHLPLLGMLTVTAILALVLFRPIAERVPPTVPEGTAPLAWWPRLAALVVDVLPGVLVAMIWFGATPAEFALLPAWSLDLEAAAPSSAAIGITVLWGLAWELPLGRTPGKMLVGGRVVAIEGGRPGVWRTVVRNLFKGVLLYAPVLAIFTALSPFGQGIGETLSRTLVLGPPREWSPPEPDQEG